LTLTYLRKVPEGLAAKMRRGCKLLPRVINVAALSFLHSYINNALAKQAMELSMGADGELAPAEHEGRSSMLQGSRRRRVDVKRCEEMFRSPFLCVVHVREELRGYTGSVGEGPSHRSLLTNKTDVPIFYFVSFLILSNTLR
jgi:hypothetical protein